VKKIQVFLSYKWEDKNYADGMDGFLMNPNNKYRHLTDRERKDLRNKGENAWKKYLKDKISNSKALICLIGQDTHNATGVIYELSVASSLSIKIIPVRIPETYGGVPGIVSKLKILKWDAREINDELSRR
jgi:hypothetical protein